MNFSRYDPSSGTFTADRHGMYHFTVDLAVNPKGLDVGIRKNSVNACRCYGKAPDDRAAVHTGCSTVLELYPADVVDVYIHGTELPDPIDGNTQMSSFKGFLIKLY